MRRFAFDVSVRAGSSIAKAEVDPSERPPGRSNAHYRTIEAEIPCRPMKSQTPAGPRLSYKRWAWIAAAALLLVVLGQQLELEAWLNSFRSHLGELGAWGPVLFAALYIVASLLVLPGSILTLAAGALFGVLKGTLTVWIAATASAALAFLFARTFAREAVARRMANQPRFAAVDRAIGDQGWKIVGLLRLSLAIPFSLSNYLFGLTSIAFGPYVFVSAVAMIPGTLL